MHVCVLYNAHLRKMRITTMIDIDVGDDSVIFTSPKTYRARCWRAWRKRAVNIFARQCVRDIDSDVNSARFRLDPFFIHRIWPRIIIISRDARHRTRRRRCQRHLFRYPAKPDDLSLLPKSPFPVYLFHFFPPFAHTRYRPSVRRKPNERFQRDRVETAPTTNGRRAMSLLRAHRLRSTRRETHSESSPNFSPSKRSLRKN